MSDTYFIHVFDITWDTYDEENDKNLDPKELGLPSEVIICDLSEIAYREVTEHPSDIVNYLSNKYGWCVLGYCTDEYTADNPNVKEIINRIGEEYAI